MVFRSDGIRELRVNDSVCLEVTIYVKPKAKKTSLRFEGEELIFLTKEPPLEGRANKSLIEYLSKSLKIPKRNIELIKGAKSRIKVFKICGITLKDFIRVFSD